MSSKDPYKYEQKKIDHVFHYTSYFPDLQNIVKKGFIPSYCKEKIANKEYLTPMVSFCNIPIGEVDKYMRYGKNGIGMSLEWAIKNGLSPVTYTHKNSPYNSILNNLSLIRIQFDLDKAFDGKTINIFGIDPVKESGLDKKSLSQAVNLKILQFLKNWETTYKGEKVVTYQEREWRYVPVEKTIFPLLAKGDVGYENFLDKKIKPKPHFPEYPLEISSIDDIKYIVVTTKLQRTKIIKTLNTRFSKEITTLALLNGTLSILTAGQIRNDF